MRMLRLGWCGTVVLASNLGVLPLHSVAQDAGDLLPPPGMGSLRQEDLAVRLDGPNVQIRLMPLDELVLRLLASDSYRSLHALREAKDAEMGRLAERFGVVEPVSFHHARFSKLIERYLLTRASLAGVVWLLDVRRDPSADDIALSDKLAQYEVPVDGSRRKSPSWADPTSANRP